MRLLRNGLLILALSLPLGFTVTKAEEPKATPISMTAVTYIVPSDPGVFQRPHSQWHIAYIETVGFRHGILRQGRGYYDRLVFRKAGDNALEVERREDNGSVGSGRLYRINMTTQRSVDSYTLSLQPVETRSYQQGLFGKFPVPKFTEQDLRAVVLLGASIDARYEVNSQYPGESILANFSRTLRPAPPPVTLSGSPILSAHTDNVFALPYRGKLVRVSATMAPYRNGSKAIFLIQVPAIETSPNTVDFKELLNGIKAELTKIVNQ